MLIFFFDKIDRISNGYKQIDKKSNIYMEDNIYKERRALYKYISSFKILIISCSGLNQYVINKRVFKSIMSLI